jgi:hypothetical protein
MRRFLLLTILVCGGVLIGVRASHADQGAPVDCSINGMLQYCPATPAPTTLPTHSPITAEKTMSVGAGTQGPAGLEQYPVSITSKLACFSLVEPVYLEALGQANSAVIVPISPSGPASANFAAVQVDAVTGQATLQLEVDTKVAEISGLDLKAIWPREGVESIVNVLLPATPTATPTSLPGLATNTPIPIPTSTLTATPGATPTATPTATPPTSTFSVSACAQPPIVQGTTIDASGGSTTIYGLTAPGAICTSGVTYYSTYDFLDYGDQFVTSTSQPDPTSYDGSGQLAASDGIVLYPLQESTTADFGIATVTCIFDGHPAQTGCTAFLISQLDTQQDFASLSPADLRTTLQKLANDHCPAGSSTT